MELKPVSFESLSSITHSIALSTQKERHTPKFVYAAFSGRYRNGGRGAPDATYIVSIMEAVQCAWYTDCLIIDLSDLSYDWGDNMARVYAIGWSTQTGCQKPLAIIVSDKCRKALSTLSPNNFKNHCVESFEDAVDLIRSKKPEYDRQMSEWRQNQTNKRLQSQHNQTNNS